MGLRLANDWILVELEPEPETFGGAIVRPGSLPSPVRIARVLQVGPGRRGPEGGRIPLEVKEGDRFPFFVATTQTKQGRALAAKLSDNQTLVRATDVLFVIPEGVEIAVEV